MPKDNNDKSWSYQTFHDANKSDRTDRPTWKTRCYEYNNSGQRKITCKKAGIGSTSDPKSSFIEVSSTNTENKASIIFKK